MVCCGGHYDDDDGGGGGDFIDRTLEEGGGAGGGGPILSENVAQPSLPAPFAADSIDTYLHSSYHEHTHALSAQ